MKTVLVALLAIILSSSLALASSSYFLWPNPQTGEATVFFRNGQSKPVETIWVGYAAWNDINQVKAKISSMIQRGVVPFM